MQYEAYERGKKVKETHRIWTKTEKLPDTKGKKKTNNNYREKYTTHAETHD